MTPENLEKLKAEIVRAMTGQTMDVALQRIPDTVSLISQTIDHLSTTHRLIDLEKVEGMRKKDDGDHSLFCVCGDCMHTHAYNRALDAVIALVKGEK